MRRASAAAILKYEVELEAMRAVWLIFAGVVNGMLSFFFTACLGWEHIDPDCGGVNFLGYPFESGKGYISPTVSEVVADNRRPAGKCFNAFAMIAATCLLMSWYPWELSNVYIGHDKKFVFHISCMSIRHFLPPLAMMVVAMVPTTPWQIADVLDKVTVILHCAAAGTMFGSYIAVELFTLSVDGPHQVHISRSNLMERPLRWISGVFCGGCICIFALAQGLLMFPESLGLCCNDDWRVPTEADVNDLILQNGTLASIHQVTYSMDSSTPMLYNTASHAVLVVKALSFWSEVLAGLSLLFNLLVIWKFCPERCIHLLKPAPTLESRELDSRELECKVLESGEDDDGSHDDFDEHAALLQC